MGIPSAETSPHPVPFHAWLHGPRPAPTHACVAMSPRAGSQGFLNQGGSQVSQFILLTLVQSQYPIQTPVSPLLSPFQNAALLPLMLESQLWADSGPAAQAPALAGHPK